MIKEIIRDEEFLKKPSRVANDDDLQTAQDLLDTLAENAERCVGLAANMIGQSVRIIAVDDNDNYTLMLNPEIVKKSQQYETEEACLSLNGTRKTTRYKTIKVQFQNLLFQTRIKTYTGFTAQIIQHEIDHCNGIII